MLESFDGRGIEPDIWVEPNEAADAIWRLCRYYNIENTTNTESLVRFIEKH